MSINPINIIVIYFSYVDEGKNPQLFTKDQLEKTLDDHKAVQKKVEAYKVRKIVQLTSIIINLFIFCSNLEMS